MDEVQQKWPEKPLGEIRYLFVEARYEKVREAGQVRDAAVLEALSLNLILALLMEIKEERQNEKLYSADKLLN